MKKGSFPQETVSAYGLCLLHLHIHFINLTVTVMSCLGSLKAHKFGCIFILLPPKTHSLSRLIEIHHPSHSSLVATFVLSIELDLTLSSNIICTNHIMRSMSILSSLCCIFVPVPSRANGHSMSVNIT